MKTNYIARIQRVISTKDYETHSIQTMRFKPFGASDESVSDLEGKPEVPDVEALIEQAQNEAQGIILNAQKEVEEIRDEAFRSATNLAFKLQRKR